jgi:hypothetical protein
VRARVAVAFLLGRLLEQDGRCSRAMARGLEMRVLDDVNARSLASLRWESCIREWGLAYGIYPWVSTLVMETEGRRFWVERGCFFRGGWGRGRGTPGHDCRDVFEGRHEFQTALFMLCIIYFAVGVFGVPCLQTITKMVLDPL